MNLNVIFLPRETIFDNILDRINVFNYNISLRNERHYTAALGSAL